MMPNCESGCAPGWWAPATWGSTTSWLYAELWDVELVGVVDTDAERAKPVAARYGTRAPSATTASSTGLVDVATVAVPTEQHFEVARDLLEAGITCSSRSR